MHARLELSRYIFTYPKLLVEGSTLFEGSYQYARYAKLFRKLEKDNTGDLKPMGVGEGDLGTYYYRKGVTTMVAVG